MKIYKNTQFNRWQDKNKISDISIINAIKEMEDGLIDADLGGNLFKKRIAKKGIGKSGSYRTIIAVKQSIGWVFIFGYEKNELTNIDAKTLKAFKIYSNDVFSNFNKFIEADLILEVLKNDK